MIAPFCTPADVAEIFDEAMHHGREWFSREAFTVFRPRGPEQWRADARARRERFRAIDAALRVQRRARRIARLGYEPCGNVKAHWRGYPLACTRPAGHDGGCAR